MSSKLDEIKAELAASTQGKWEWKGRVAPDWMPDTWAAVDDLRVQIPTPEKDYDADLWFVLEGTKSGFIMVRNADAELIANAPDYLRLLLPIVEAAANMDKSRLNYLISYLQGWDDAEALLDALKALE